MHRPASYPPIPYVDPANRMRLVAHRGSSIGVTENTEGAMQRAIDLEADMFECDLRTTSDGALVLMHDSTVDRTTTGTGTVATMTLAQVKALTCDDGQPVPDIDEILDLLVGQTRTGALLEFKGMTTASYQLLADKLIARGIVDRCGVSSFDTTELANFAALCPGIRMTRHISGTGTVADVQPAHIANIPADELSQAKVDELHAGGLEVYCRVSNIATEWRIAADYGCDGLSTDNVAGFKVWAPDHDPLAS